MMKPCQQLPWWFLWCASWQSSQRYRGTWAVCPEWTSHTATEGNAQMSWGCSYTQRWHWWWHRPAEESAPTGGRRQKKKWWCLKRILLYSSLSSFINIFAIFLEPNYEGRYIRKCDLKGQFNLNTKCIVFLFPVVLFMSLDDLQSFCGVLHLSNILQLNGIRLKCSMHPHKKYLWKTQITMALISLLKVIHPKTLLWVVSCRKQFSFCQLHHCT